MAADDPTRDPWERGDCEEGPPPGYAEREAARRQTTDPKETPCPR